MVSPYRNACGAKTRSMLAVVETSSACTHCALGLAGVSSADIGPAARPMVSVRGMRMTMVHVSRADVIWLTCAFSPGSVKDRSAERASTGTMALPSAPPSTSSATRSGTWLAVK